MHYNDYVTESRNRSYQNGEGGEPKIEKGYRRSVVFIAQDDTVPDFFMDRYGGRDAGAELRWGRIEYSWENERNYGSDWPTLPSQWRITEIRVTGNYLKKDGTPGERETSKGFYLNSEDSAPPDWLAKIVTDYHPDGELHPFPEDVRGKES